MALGSPHAGIQIESDPGIKIKFAAPIMNHRKYRKTRSCATLVRVIAKATFVQLVANAANHVDVFW
jgi:hypothetical protein